MAETKEKSTEARNPRRKSFETETESEKKRILGIIDRSHKQSLKIHMVPDILYRTSSNLNYEFNLG